MDQKIMHALSYGLFVLSARQGEKDNGCIINTAIQVTAAPNRIVMAVSKDNLTHDMVRDSGQPAWRTSPGTGTGCATSPAR